jgi:hypothetical protein
LLASEDVEIIPCLPGTAGASDQPDVKRSILNSQSHKPGIRQRNFELIGSHRYLDREIRDDALGRENSQDIQIPDFRSHQDCA